MNDVRSATFSAAAKTMFPIITGFIPTAAAYGLLCVNQGIPPFYAILSSIMVYAGSVQFLAIELMGQQMRLLQFSIIILLLHSRHMFYGISVFDKFSKFRRTKPAMIFWLTDEVYAVFTGTKTPTHVNEKLYYFLLAFLGYAAWNVGTALGVLASNYLKFDLKGLDFTMTAMFLVIAIEQYKTYKSKLPFVIGGVTAIVSLFVFGPGTMLLGCAAGSVVLLIIFRERISGVK